MPKTKVKKFIVQGSTSTASQKANNKATTGMIKTLMILLLPDLTYIDAGHYTICK